MGAVKSRQKTKEGLKVQIQEFNNKFQTALLGCYQAKRTFITLSDLWSSSRCEVITTIQTVAKEINRHHRNVNLASLTGTSSSIAGGTAAIGGLILSPFSGGLSLAMSAGGLVGTVAGSATTLGANLAEVYLTKDLTERASKALETDTFYTKALSAAFKEVVLHEQDVLVILSELRNETLLDDLEKVLRASPCCDEVKKRFCHLKSGGNSLEDILVLIKSLYSEDKEFLNQLTKTDNLFSDAPSFSRTISSSSEFFQAMKELATMGPETLKGISGAALQSTAVSNAQVASLTTQVITAGLGAIFVALDIYHYMKVSKNYDAGSKTELASKLQKVSEDLANEKEQITKLSEFYRQQVKVDLFNDS
uniref:Apolipoprotein L3 n=2 Tax=Parasteatoda tepidariorum TaxID=114398 RepID=A0A2L2YJ05_PARTP